MWSAPVLSITAIVAILLMIFLRREKRRGLMFSTVDNSPLEAWVKAMLALWIILLLPWPIALMGAGMSGEGGGSHVAVSTLIWSVLSYPALVLVAFIFRRRMPSLVFLPALSFAVGLTAGLFL
jgi:hypothetical protein